MPRIEAIIFDKDGVIIDSEPIHLDVVKEITRDIDLKISESELQRYVGSSTLEMWADIIQRYELVQTPEDLAGITKARITDRYKSDRNLPEVPGVAGLIREAHEKGMKLALASSSSMEHIDIVLQKLALAPFFPHKVSGADLPKSKPDPMIFRKAANLLNTKPEFCLVIEDSYNGVTAAKAAGMACIGFRNPNSGNQDLGKADLVIEEFQGQTLKSLLVNL